MVVNFEKTHVEISRWKPELFIYVAPGWRPDQRVGGQSPQQPVSDLNALATLFLESQKACQQQMLEAQQANQKQMRDDLKCVMKQVRDAQNAPPPPPIETQVAHQPFQAPVVNPPVVQVNASGCISCCAQNCMTKASYCHASAAGLVQHFHCSNIFNNPFGGRPSAILF